MFETFVFGTQAQTANANIFNEDISASPTDCSFPPTAPSQTSCPGRYKPGGLNDIVNQLSQQTLRPEYDERPQQSIWNESNISSPNFDDDPRAEFSAEELSYISSTRGRVPLRHHTTQSVPTLPSVQPSRGTVACRRLQRQLNVQLQGCASHMKDLSTLVEDMISTQSQCRILTPSSTHPHMVLPTHEADHPTSSNTSIELDTDQPLIPADDDEGFVEMNEDDFLELNAAAELRRASMPNGIRKYNLVGWRKSADCVNAVNSQGRMKVRNVPRMRRRPHTRVRDVRCTTAS